MKEQPIPPRQHSDEPCATLRDEPVFRAAGTHPICYPFIEVARAHNSLYPSEPHIVSDSVAHARKTQG